jgi:arylsulfotransferase ASST
MFALAQAHIKRTNLVLLAILCGSAAGALTSARAAAPIGAFTTKGTYSYVSAPNLHPPKIPTDAPTVANRLAPGFFMISVFKNFAMKVPMIGRGGPLMLDSKLKPVWSFPTPLNVYSLNFRTQTYNGKPALSWWEGTVSPLFEFTGTDYVVDQHYRQIAKLTGADGWSISPHEFVINGNVAWVTANKDVQVDLTPEGGLPNGILTDSAVQEYDLKTGKLLYSFDAYNPGGTPNVPLSESQTHPAPVLVMGHVIPWDAYHVNAVSLVGNNEFVTSFRSTWGIYLVNFKTNTIVWTLGTQHNNSFTFGPNAQFEWQHDPTILPNNEISLFDDACCNIIQGMPAPPNGPSRGLVLKLDTSAHTANVAGQYLQTASQSPHGGLDTSSQGSTQVLPNGNVVVGYGGQPWFSEYSKSGQLLLDARLPDPDTSYRAYVEPWIGTPFFPPSGAARKAKGKTTIYASWDGATQVVSWTVLAGPNAKHLTNVATHTKSDFETSIRLAHSYKVYKLQALDSKGHVLGTSRAFSVPKPGTPSPTGFY